MAWQTADGRVIKLEDLTYSHLLNIVKFTFSHNQIAESVIREGLRRHLFKHVLGLQPYPGDAHDGVGFVISYLSQGFYPHWTLNGLQQTGRLPEVAALIPAQEGYKSPEELASDKFSAAVEEGVAQVEQGKVVDGRTAIANIKAARNNAGKLPVGLVPVELIEGVARMMGQGLRVDLIPLSFIESLAKVLTRGAIKYTKDGVPGDHNWKLSLNTDDHDSFVYDRTESLLRHYLSSKKGELLDPEVVTGAEDIQVTHYEAAAINALFANWYETQRQEGV